MLQRNGSFVFSFDFLNFFFNPLFFVSVLSVPESPPKASGFLLSLMLFCNFVFSLWHELLGIWKSTWDRDYRPGHCLVHRSDGQAGREEVAAHYFSPCIWMYGCRNTNHNTCFAAGSKLAQFHLSNVIVRTMDFFWILIRFRLDPTIFCAWWIPPPTPMISFMQQGYVVPSPNSSFSILWVFSVAFHSDCKLEQLCFNATVRTEVLQMS